MARIEIDLDRIFHNNHLVGRISPNLPIATIREFEECCTGIYAPDEVKKTMDSSRDELIAKIMDNIRKFATGSGGLLTVQEIEDIFKEEIG